MKRVLAVVLLMGLALPAQAHSEAELERWLESHDKLEESLTITLAPGDQLRFDLETAFDAVYEDMRSRHGCSKVMKTWVEEDCVRPEPVHRGAGDSGSSGAGSSGGSSGSTSMGSNVEQWRGLVSAYFAADQVERALCIMSHESGGNPGAKNPRSSAAGLFQFLKSTWDSMVPSSVTGGSYSSGRVFNAEANIAAAAWLSSNVGWSQWSPYQRGRCR